MNAASAPGERRAVLTHHLSPRQLDVLLKAGVITWLRQKIAAC